MPADPADLEGQLAAYGDAAHLVTVNDAGAPHVVAVAVERTGEGLTAAVGSHSRANATARPLVTLLFSPPDKGYTLVVDGEAAVAGERLVIRPASALLHRDADATGPGPRCYAVTVDPAGERR